MKSNKYVTLVLATKVFRLYVATLHRASFRNVMFWHAVERTVCSKYKILYRIEKFKEAGLRSRSLKMFASNGNAVEESRNIEIKAKIGSDDEYNRRVNIAKKLVGNEGEIIVQRDVFYNVSSGRLKLRYLKVRILLRYLDKIFT